MARVAVVGGGFAGMAAAARLAKLGHAVTLYERRDRPGGVVGGTWPATGPLTMPLPAAIRDLFRKSGRPLERVVELVPVRTPRRHVFADGSRLDLPLASRSEQHDALADAFGPATASTWTGLVDGLDSTWEQIRTRVLEPPAGEGERWRRLAKLATPSVRRLADRSLPDVRARRILEYVATAAGEPPDRAPAFLAVHAYVERTFGRWTGPGGDLTPLVGALSDRLAERGVAVHLGTEVREITGGTTVTGVRLDDGVDVPADIVICAVPPHLVRTEYRRTARLRLAAPTPTVGLELTEPVPGQPFETVWHGAPTLVLEAPEANPRWRLRALGDPGGADLVDLLAERGLDLRDRIRSRVDAESAPYGPLWDRFGTPRRLAPNRSRTRGLFCVGGSARPGPGLPYVLLGAAAVAQHIGKA